MLYPEKIHHAQVIVADNNIHDLITTLHEKGLCELKESDIDLPTKFEFGFAKKAEEIDSRLKSLLSSLKPYEEIEQPESKISSLFSRKQPRKIQITHEQPERYIDNIMGCIQAVEDNSRVALAIVNEFEAKIHYNEIIIENLEMMPDIRTRVYEPTENLKSKIGIISKKKAEDIHFSEGVVWLIEDIDHERSLIITISRPDMYQEVESLLHTIGFSVFEIPFEDKTPPQIIASLRKENEAYTKEIRNYKKKLEKISKEHTKSIEAWINALDVYQERIYALELFRSTKAFCVFYAWIPDKNLEEFDKVIREYSPDYYLEIEEKEQAPTLMKNSKFIRPFEILTSLYSLPKHGRLDPTLFLAIFFTIFFGFMLDDFFYGLIFVIIGIFMIFTTGTYQESMKNIGILITILGISTMFWGVVFGSYFGNYFQMIGMSPPMLIDAMKNVLLVLGISILFGVIHLLVGLILGFYENIRIKEHAYAFHYQGVWLVFMAGIALIFFMQMIPGLILVGISIVMKIYFTYVSDGAATAVLSIFNFPGFMGDIFSYARLTALGIGTGGIALAVNFMAKLTNDMIPYVGIVVAIFIFILGHIFNLAMNGLGSFIHAIRLHFLEFFTKFYEGGGTAYKPFMVDKEKVSIK